MVVGFATEGKGGMKNLACRFRQLGPTLSLWSLPGNRSHLGPSFVFFTLHDYMPLNGFMVQCSFLAIPVRRWDEPSTRRMGPKLVLTTARTMENERGLWGKLHTSHGVQFVKGLWFTTWATLFPQPVQLRRSALWHPCERNALTESMRHSINAAVYLNDHSVQ